MQVAIAAGLAAGSIVILLLAVVAGLIVLFLWLEPRYGNLAAAGIIGALLLAIAVVLAICAYATFAKKTPSVVIADIPPPQAADAEVGAASREGMTEPQVRPISLGEVDAMFGGPLRTHAPDRDRADRQPRPRGLAQSRGGNAGSRRARRQPGSSR